MFSVGDKVVYPMHGAGIIEAIEEREILGERQKYYIMKMPFGSMRVMIPMKNVHSLGLRQVIGLEDVERVMGILKEKKTTMSANWNRRFKANMDKMKSGNIFEVAEVVKDLALQDKEKKLSTGERRLLDNARQILISELVLAQGMTEEKAEDLLNKLFAK